MPIKLLLFALGVIAAGFSPYLPSLFFLLLLLPLALAGCYWYWPRYAFALCAGIAWAIYSGHELLAHQLPVEFEGRDLLVTGQVQGLPERDERRERFNLRITHMATVAGTAIDLDQLPHKLQLSWYQRPAYGPPKANSAGHPPLVIGDTWQLRVRLKRPRGFVNPAGFDYQAWLLRQGIGATGYVVEHRDNQRLEHDAVPFSWDDWINRQRYELQQWVIDRSDSTERGILVALLIGDSALVEKNQWLRMQQTGTSHLIAISGLHVGFLALFGFYLGLLVGKCVQLIWHRCPALFMAWLMAIVCAAFYSALAGFNIPTVRTLIMLVLFYLACLARRSVRIVDIFCCALVLVVIIDPLAAFDMGFWLSFGAVALLLIYFSGRLVSKQTTEPWAAFTGKEMIVGFIRSQWVMFIGLLLPLSLLVNSISMVAPVANALAIPLITFLVVPLLLISAALRNTFSALSDFLLTQAARLMEILGQFLDGLLAFSGVWASPNVAFSPWVILLLALITLSMVLPRSLFPRYIAWLGLLLVATLMFFVVPPQQPALKIAVLDVGQGTAVVVQVGARTLVYDTGPKYTDSFDAGGAIVAPYLLAQGVRHVDRLVVSHGDMDHAGGVAGLLEKISVLELLMGESARSFPSSSPLVAAPHQQDCHTAPDWHWQSVRFSFLAVAPVLRNNPNNHSCVLLITYAGQHILLPGDIETSVEQQLLAAGVVPEKLALLLAAHHGSRTSSGYLFVNHAQPAIVVYSAAYRSQHGHPHPHVRKRFQVVGSRELSTAESGALVFSWAPDSAVVVEEYRQVQRRYWFDGSQLN